MGHLPRRTGDPRAGDRLPGQRCRSLTKTGGEVRGGGQEPGRLPQGSSLWRPWLKRLERGGGLFGFCFCAYYLVSWPEGRDPAVGLEEVAFSPTSGVWGNLGLGRRPALTPPGALPPATMRGLEGPPGRTGMLMEGLGRAGRGTE